MDSETSHINTFRQVLSKLSSQGINFEEEVKALALLSNLLASWEVFCTTFTNNCLKPNVDETIDQIITEDIWRKSMRLTIDESAEAHHSTDTVDQENKPTKPVEIIADKKKGETDNGQSLERVDQANSTSIAEKPVIMFPIAGQSRGKRVVGDPSIIEDDLTRTTLQLATKSMLLIPDWEKSSP